MLNKYQNLNELINTTRDNYNIDCAIKDVDMNINYLDEAYANYVGERNSPQNLTTYNPGISDEFDDGQSTYREAKAVSKEALKMMKMTPAQVRTATATPSNMKAAIPVTTKDVPEKKLEGAEYYFNYWKKRMYGIITMYMAMPVLKYLVMISKKALSLGKLKFTAEQWKEPITANPILGYAIYGYALFAIAGACFRIKRKFFKKKNKNENEILSMPQEQHEYLNYLDEIYSEQSVYNIIQESVEDLAPKKVSNLNKFADEGLALMANLGAQIKPNKNADIGKFDKICLMVEKAGVVCMVKIKGNSNKIKKTNRRK